MKSVNKVQTATEADWSFFSDERAVKAVEQAALKAERKFEHIDYEDAYQDALLWLSVRPGRYQQATEDGNWPQLRQDIYSPLAKRLKAQAKKQSWPAPYEEGFE